MVAFRPAPPPFLKSVLVNPAVLIAMTFALVMSSVVYIRMKQRQELSNRAEMLRSGPMIVEQATTPTEHLEAASQAAHPHPLPAGQNEMAAPAPPPPTAVTETSEGLAAGGTPTLPPTAPIPPVPSAKGIASLGATENAALAAKIERKVTLTVSYAEVEKLALTQMMEESQATGQFTDFGDYKSGALPNLASRLGGDHAVKVLQKIVRRFDSKTLENRWFVGNPNDPDGPGLTTLVVLQPATDEHVRGEIEIMQQLLVEGSDGLVKKGSPASSFDLSPGTGWMVVMSLPKRDQSPPGVGIEGFLRLFKSASFLAHKTEFTLFADFDTRSP